MIRDTSVMFQSWITLASDEEHKKRDTHPLRPYIQVAHQRDDLAEWENQQRVLQRRALHSLDNPQDPRFGLEIVCCQHRITRRGSESHSVWPQARHRFLVLPEHGPLGVGQIQRLHYAFSRHEGFGRLLGHTGSLCCLCAISLSVANTATDESVAAIE